MTRPTPGARSASVKRWSVRARSVRVLANRVVAGAALLAAAIAGLLPAGCAQSAPTRSAPAACGSAAPNAVHVDAALRDGRADPEPRRVEVSADSPILLGVSSDVAAEVHVHGYDLVYPVQPGSPACVLFVADRTGVFDVEAHPEILLLQLEVR